jgi:light-regulated signal transduction histidine kinase (bacteriophytochrome)
MRALTGYDRVTLTCGKHRAESSRGAFAAPADLAIDAPAIVADVDAVSVGIFPRRPSDAAMDDALLRSPGSGAVDQLRREGVRSCLSVPFAVDDISGEFRCDSRSPRPPHFELHAAAELFAQLFAMRLEIDRFKNG